MSLPDQRLAVIDDRPAVLAARGEAAREPLEGFRLALVALHRGRRLARVEAHDLAAGVARLEREQREHVVLLEQGRADDRRVVLLFVLVVEFLGLVRVLRLLGFPVAVNVYDVVEKVVVIFHLPISFSEILPFDEVSRNIPCPEPDVYYTLRGRRTKERGEKEWAALCSRLTRGRPAQPRSSSTATAACAGAATRSLRSTTRAPDGSSTTRKKSGA